MHGSMRRYEEETHYESRNGNCILIRSHPGDALVSIKRISAGLTNTANLIINKTHS